MKRGRTINKTDEESDSKMLRIPRDVYDAIEAASKVYFGKRSVSNLAADMLGQMLALMNASEEKDWHVPPIAVQCMAARKRKRFTAESNSAPISDAQRIGVAAAAGEEDEQDPSP